MRETKRPRARLQLAGVMVDRKVTEMDSNPSIADFEEEDEGRDGPLDRLCLVVAALSIPGVLPALAIAAAPVVADALGPWLLPLLAAPAVYGFLWFMTRN